MHQCDAALKLFTIEKEEENDSQEQNHKTRVNRHQLQTPGKIM